MSQLKAVVGQLFVIAHHELLLVLLGALLLASAGTTDHLSMSLSFLLTMKDTSDYVLIRATAKHVSVGGLNLGRTTSLSACQGKVRWQP